MQLDLPTYPKIWRHMWMLPKVISCLLFWPAFNWRFFLEKKNSASCFLKQSFIGNRLPFGAEFFQVLKNELTMPEYWKKSPSFLICKTILDVDMTNLETRNQQDQILVETLPFALNCLVLTNFLPDQSSGPRQSQWRHLNHIYAISSQEQLQAWIENWKPFS